MRHFTQIVGPHPILHANQQAAIRRNAKPLSEERRKLVWQEIEEAAARHRQGQKS